MFMVLDADDPHTISSDPYMSFETWTLFLTLLFFVHWNIHVLLERKGGLTGEKMAVKNIAKKIGVQTLIQKQR